jgi:hypothetical protein
MHDLRLRMLLLALLAMASTAGAQQADATTAPPADTLEAELKSLTLADLQAIVTAQGHRITETSTDPDDLWVNAETDGNLRYIVSATDCAHREERGCFAMLISIYFDNPDNNVLLDRINKANLAVPSIQVWLDRANYNRIGFSRLATLHGGRTRRSLALELDLVLVEFWTAYDQVWPGRRDPESKAN